MPSVCCSYRLWRSNWRNHVQKEKRIAFANTLKSSLWLCSEYPFLYLSFARHGIAMRSGHCIEITTVNRIDTNRSRVEEYLQSISFIAGNHETCDGPFDFRVARQISETQCDNKWTYCLVKPSRRKMYVKCPNERFSFPSIFTVIGWQNESIGNILMWLTG